MLSSNLRNRAGPLWNCADENGLTPETTRLLAGYLDNLADDAEALERQIVPAGSRETIDNLPDGVVAFPAIKGGKR